MGWTRKPLMRALALVASAALVITHWDERGAWFWLGVSLLVLNVAGILTTRSLAGHAEPPIASPWPDPRVDDQPEIGKSHRLVEFLSSPGVAEAFAQGPQIWRQVSYHEHAQVEPTTAHELAAFVWLEHDEGWAIDLGDEIKPYVDLDIEDADDPAIIVLKSHPAVADAFHGEREVYRVEERRPIGPDEFAELAARALVSHHMHAATGA